MPDDEPIAPEKMDPAADEPAPVAGGAAFPIVGAGASAGGIEALKQFLGALPVDTGMGFVIVQHLAPERESGLAEILARATKMPVCEVRGEPAVEPDHVYVIPPGRDMILEGGTLRLAPQESHAGPRGIDRFFRSLAADSGHLAIGVVLSGSASEGTFGLEEIKAAGGVNFAQDDSARQPGAPRNAVAAGCVDFVLPPAGIARELARLARHPYVAAEALVADAGQPLHSAIAELVRRATGVDFTHYKANTLHRRITRRMMLHRLEAPREYEAHLRRTPAEIEALYQDILIGVTSFFRNPEAFDALARMVFPKLLAACAPEEPVRLWTVGCASGEEAYSLAIVFAECAEAAGSAARLQLFATDVNARCIEKARAGFYPRTIAQDVSPERLQRFFTEEGGGYRIRKAIRERCIFSRHNVVADPPFSRLDFISCRNLLIYLEPVLQQRIVPLFHYALKPGGWLWLGSSESPGTARGLFEAGDARHKIFVRQPGDRPPAARLQALPAGRLPLEPAGPRQPAHGGLHRDAERLLLAKYAPPGVVVSAGLEIVQFQGDTGPYLAPAAGAASLLLLKMLREGLAAGVRDAIQRAEKEGGPVRVEGLRVRSNGGFRSLAVEVIPIKPGAGKGGGFVVLFDDQRKPAPAAVRGSWWSRLLGGRDVLPAAIRDEENLHLTQELAATRETLQTVMEQHEAAHEGAQSAHEEMQSINEELETSKEEIEASNEELATLNDELSSGNAELNRLNEELRHARDHAERILENVPRPLVVLDGALRVRSASLAFYQAFRVAPAETEGQFIHELGNGQWDIPDLRRLLEEVLPRKNAIDAFEVRHTFENLGPRVMCLSARRLAQGLGNEPLIILAFEDITERSGAEEALRESEERFRAIAENIPQLAWMADAECRVDWFNWRWLDYTGTTLEGNQGAGWKAVHHPDYVEAVAEKFERHLREGRDWEDTFPLRGKDGTYRWFLSRMNVIRDEAGKVVRFFGTNTDVTEQRAMAERLRASEARATGIIQSIADGFITLDLDWRITFLSARGAEILAPLQKSTTNVLGKIFWDEFPGTVGMVIEENYRRAIREQVTVRFETYYPPLDRWFEIRAYPSPGGLTIYFLDTTERQHAAEALRLSEQALAEQADALRAADRSKDEFLAMLAHELRNPLAPLRNATELLQTADASADERTQAQRILGRQIENMSRMIDDLLDVSRITEGKIELRRKPVALEEIITAAVSLARSGCAAHRQELEVSLPAEPVWLHADATRLEQVLGNLLGNACKYSGDGCHISLTVEVGHESHSSHAVGERGEMGPMVVITVKDDGAGIEPELLPRIFDLFVQASRTLDRAHGGLGIGLTLVQRLVHLHGGSIEARSEGLGHGAEFIVRLPILREAPPPPAPLPPAVHEAARRILIVDDNTDSARSLALLQTRRGHETRTAFTGPDAVAAAAKFLPEVVLLDIGLPGMDGFEVARQLRAMPALSGTFLIAMSGYGSAEDRAHARLAGFDEYLVKPVDLDRLRDLLKTP